MNHQLSDLHQKIDAGVHKAIAEAVERHRRLGESIAISQDGKVVILSPEEIPPLIANKPQEN
ncbi:MAG: hypothetical protein RLZZ148_438 [Cyanobacteriota bacterium]|jgi:hypothetical protein